MKLSYSDLRLIPSSYIGIFDYSNYIGMTDDISFKIKSNIYYNVFDSLFKIKNRLLTSYHG